MLRDSGFWPLRLARFRGKLLQPSNLAIDGGQVGLNDLRQL